MMDTVLNLGPQRGRRCTGLIALTGNERFGWDAYRRFIQMFGRIVHGRRRRALRPRPRRRQAGPRREAGHGPRRGRAARGRRRRSRRSSARTPAATSRPTRYEQLDLAIKAVFASWFGKRAHDYREYNKIAARPGHRRQRRDDGLRQHGRRLGHRRRLHARPEHRREGALRRVPDQRPGRGRRGRHPHAAADQPDARRHARRSTPSSSGSPSGSSATTATSRTSSSRSSAAACTCSRRARAKRTAAAAVKIAVDMVDEGIITEAEAIGRIEPAHVDQLLRDQFDPEARKAARRASPRASTRRRAPPSAGPSSTPTTRSSGSSAGEQVILVRIETSPDDFHGMAVAAGHPDRPRRRHVARRRRRAPDRQAVRGGLRGAGHRLRRRRRPTRPTPARASREGDWISLDGSTGEVFLGALPTVAGALRGPGRAPDGSSAGPTRSGASGVWTNADKPEEAAQARSYGAQGIGLCRTEHMFREGERLEIVRDAILVAFQATRAKERVAAGETLDADEREAVAPLRRRDGQARGAPAGRLRGHLRGDGRPAGRHPAHRPAAPRVPAQPRGAAGQGHRGPDDAGDPTEDSELLAAIKSLHEQNPMLGLRGCRLGLMIPDFVKIQTRAILNAADRGQARPAATRSPRS